MKRQISFSKFLFFIMFFLILCTNSFIAQFHSNKNLDSKNVVLIGECETLGYTRSVATKGLYVYVTDLKEGLVIIELENPFQPQIIGSIKFSQVALDVKIKGRFAFVSVNHGLRIVDVNNPKSPIQISEFDIPGFADGLDIKDNLVYLTDAPGNLRIIDVSNPYYPIEIGNYSNLLFPSDVKVSGNYVYIADENSLQVINVENPYQPVFTSKYSTFADHLDINVGFLYLADYHDYLKIFDITDPTSLKLLSQYKTPSWPADVSASFKFAYVADSPAGMRVIDISNPYIPKEIGYFDNESIRASGITSYGRLIFVAGGDKLYVLLNTVNTFGLAKKTSELEDLIINKLNENEVTSKYILNQNYPNPFNPTTVIKYEIPIDIRYEARDVRLKIYDILGREVVTLVNKKQTSGYYKVVWDAGNQPSGIYFYKLAVGDFVEIKKMILIR